VGLSFDLDRTSNTSLRIAKPTYPTTVFVLTPYGKDGSDTNATNTPPCCAKLLNHLCFAFQKVPNPSSSAIPCPKMIWSVFPCSPPWLYPVPECQIHHQPSRPPIPGTKSTSTNTPWMRSIQDPACPSPSYLSVQMTAYTSATGQTGAKSVPLAPSRRVERCELRENVTRRFPEHCQRLPFVGSL